MRLFSCAVAVVAVLTGSVVAGEDGLTGYWKFSFYDGGQPITFWIIHLDKDKDNKLTASGTSLKGTPPLKIEDLKQDGDVLKMKLVATITVQGQARQVPFDYEAKLPKPGAKKIYGSLTQGGQSMPVIMEMTNAKNAFELDRDLLQRTPNDPKALVAVFDLIARAKDNKVDAKDLQAWVDSSLKAAETYGPRFQAAHQLQVLEALLAQKTFAKVAIETARKIGKQSGAGVPVDTQVQIMTAVADVFRANDLKDEAKTHAAETARKISKQIDKMPLDGQLSVLSTLAGVLRNNDGKDEAGQYDGRIEKLENQAYTEHLASKNALNFKPMKYAGRKGKSDRAVLVEMFTGAQCPPCVAADMAFDGLEKTYGPGEIVLLQFHLHVPGPDPMSTADGYGRFDYYADAYPGKVRGTPTCLFNGKLDAPFGGAREDAPEKYEEYCKVVNKALETPATAKLSASAVRTGPKIAITAKVEDLSKPGEKVRVRLALVEDWVRFKGSNGLLYHHRIVRAMPGSAKGFACKEKSSEHKASVDVDELRTALNKFLNEDYPDGPRPLRLQNLSVVALVQDDTTFEVLQAVNVPIRAEK